MVLFKIAYSITLIKTTCKWWRKSMQQNLYSISLRIFLHANSFALGKFDRDKKSSDYKRQPEMQGFQFKTQDVHFHIPRVEKVHCLGGTLPDMFASSLSSLTTFSVMFMTIPYHFLFVVSFLLACTNFHHFQVARFRLSHRTLTSTMTLS